MGEFCESERTRIERWGKFQLPNSYKKIGWGVVIVSFLLMITKLFFDEPKWVKPLLRNTMLLGLLIVSVSKEKIEDELMASLRSISYRLAIIIGVLYATVLPYILSGILLLIAPDWAEMDTSYFEVLLYMLFVQIMFFNVLKRSMK